jgi:hypothetical protein
VYAFPCPLCKHRYANRYSAVAHIKAKTCAEDDLDIIEGETISEIEEDPNHNRV